MGRSTPLILALGLTTALAPLGMVVAQSAPANVRDLVGAQAPAGESALMARGYANVGSEAGDDRRWTYWWNARRGLCLSVVTMNGRLDAITPSPAPDCRRERSATLPGPIGPAVTNGRIEQLRFDRGATTASRRGAIKGYETMSYLIDLRAGQTFTVSMQSSNLSAYFNITAPHSDRALFNGSISGPRYHGRAATAGPYKIDIYLMRSAARRAESARFTLDVSAAR